MNSPLSQFLFRRALPPALFFAAAIGLHGASANNPLLENNPFVPEGWQPPQPRQPPPQPQRPPPPAQPQPLDRLEFRSIARFNGVETFSLFDPTENRRFWLGLNQTDSGFTVTDYNPKEDSVVVKHEGKTRTIALHEAKIQAMAEAPTPATARPGPGGRPTAQPAASPEERMQDLAEEIRRRREIRRQLVEGAQQQSPTPEVSEQVTMEPPLPPNPGY
jgi:hypothetical protein